MEDHQIEALLNRYKAGKATEEEVNFLLYHLQQIEVDPEFEIFPDEIERKTSVIWGRIETANRNKKQFRLYTRIAAAAAVVAVVLGVWFYTSRHLEGSKATRDLLNYANDIAPGSNKATLTLADGKVINLSSTKLGVVVGDDLSYNDKTPVILNHDLSSRGKRSDTETSSAQAVRSLPYGRDDGKEAKPTMLTASTPRGGTYQVTLPDGTKVWLNAASSLKFPSSFSKLTRRTVELSGEAYFEVAPLSSLREGTTKQPYLERVPFIVVSKGQTVEVLGTHFNINSYTDEAEVKTTLLEGSVKVASLSAMGRDVARDREVLLKPNQQASLSNSGLAVKEIDAREAIAWKNGYFQFNGKTLEDAMQEVARWYNVDIEYKANVLRSTPLGGTISKYGNVSQVLKKIELTGLVHFRINGRKITVE